MRLCPAPIFIPERGLEKAKRGKEERNADGGSDGRGRV